jgi:hypothetical protein
MVAARRHLFATHIGAIAWVVTASLSRLSLTEALAAPPKTAPSSSASAPPPLPLSPVRKAEIVKALEGDASSLQSALREIRLLAPASAAEFGAALANVLSVGVPEQLAPEVLELTAATYGSSAVTIVSYYLKHRNPLVRIASAQAMGALAAKAPSSVPVALTASLAVEHDANVRKALMAALGEMQPLSAEAEAALGALLEKGAVDAMLPLARACTRCDALSVAVASAPFDQVSQISKTIFARAKKVDAAKPFEGAQLRLLDALQALGSKDAASLLRDLRTEFGANVSKSVKAKMDSAAGSAEK